VNSSIFLTNKPSLLEGSYTYDELSFFGATVCPIKLFDGAAAAKDSFFYLYLYTLPDGRVRLTPYLSPHRTPKFVVRPEAREGWSIVVVGCYPTMCCVYEHLRHPLELAFL
jgi:hypothetical protein